jgi:hypothetical protein
MNQHNDIPELEVLGPDCIPEWHERYFKNHLCHRCLQTFSDLDELGQQEAELTNVHRGEEPDTLRILWDDDTGPTLKEVRTAAYSCCHFCTMIISQWLEGRRSLRLGAEKDGIGWNRRRQDMLYENDRVHLKLRKVHGKLVLTGGIRMWCAGGDRGAPDLIENVSIQRKVRRFTRRASVYGRGEILEEIEYKLAAFHFVLLDEPDTYFTPLGLRKPGYQVSPVEPLIENNSIDRSPPQFDGKLITLHFPGSLESCKTPTRVSARSPPLNGPQIWMRAEEIAYLWLNDCLRSHDCSSNDMSDPILPFRVIDIEGRKGDGDPFLLQTSGERAKYITLSYRWGNCRQFTLLSDNLEDRQHSIPLSEMPQTYKDVVILARELGFSYLWIDALCIIQDSEEDCLQQLSKMAGIYGNSTLTVAAIGSIDAADGCTPCRNKLAMNDCRISNQRVVSRESRSHTRLLEQGSIHDRGWCFQETEISPRLLSVGASKLYWQCRRGVRRECEPAMTTSAYDWQFHERHDGEPIHFHSWPTRNRIFDELAVPDPFQAYNRWYWLIERYSRRHLTFSRDKLPALSGLAERFLDLFAREEDRPNAKDYYCGIWRQDLLPGLLWREIGTMEQPNVYITQQQVYFTFRAPSWSWASYHDAVEFAFQSYPRPEIAFYSTVLDVAVVPVSSKVPFGAVRSGKLTLLGPTLPLTESGDLSLESIIKNNWIHTNVRVDDQKEDAECSVSQNPPKARSEVSDEDIFIMEEVGSLPVAVEGVFN